MRAFKTHPLGGLINSYVIDSPQPSNISYAWNGGSLLAICLITQLATGIFLAMHYIGSAELAFISVEGIMRDVWGGAMIRYIHANTASLFFAVIYLHIARGLWYGSYRTPRTMTWNIGVVIFILLMGTAFMGYWYSPKWVYPFNSLFTSISNPEVGDVPSFFLLSLVQKQGKEAMKKEGNYWGYSSLFSINLSMNDNEQKTTKFPSFTVQDFILEHHLKPVHIYEDLGSDLVKSKVLKDLQSLSGVYLILNKVTLDFYIGSASTGKFYSRFLNHLFYYHGSKIVKLAVQKYKIKSFAFLVLETIPEITNRENNKSLLDLEDLYLKTLLPNYNILTEAGNSFGYKHTEITRLKMKTLYSNERRERIGNLNRGTSLKPEIKALMKERALKREPRIFSPEVLLTMKKKSKPVLVRNLNGTVYGEFPSITDTALHLKCGVKTVYRALRKINDRKLVKRKFLVELINKAKV